jgi:hypothetical protein
MDFFFPHDNKDGEESPLREVWHENNILFPRMWILRPEIY